MLTPYRLDTNSLLLTDRLNKLGIEVARKVVVGDDAAELRDAFRQALERVEVVIAIGGLGPTADDLTRETVAELLGRKLLLDERVLRAIQERFRRFGRQMAEVNTRQAMVPEGAEVLENSRGTAPGLWLETKGRVVILLPGPPRELEAMFAEQVQARLGARAGDVRLYSRELRIAGMPESDVEQRVGPVYSQYGDVQTTILAFPGEIQIHLRAWSPEQATAELLLNEMVERLTLALGDHVFSTRGETLEQVVAEQLTMNNATIAVAESCTGGLVAERLTTVPGSSTFFRGGVVCYSNDLKSAWVDVPAEMIEARGAVSNEVACAMADGVRRRAGSTLGLAVTGIAGPGGGTVEKPAGTVHIALGNGTATKERAFRFPGDRERIRQQASQSALDMVRRYFLYAAQTKT
jgi:nicotinamide-nucleotide amidase